MHFISLLVYFHPIMARIIYGHMNVQTWAAYGSRPMHYKVAL